MYIKHNIIAHLNNKSFVIILSIFTLNSHLKFIIVKCVYFKRIISSYNTLHPGVVEFTRRRNKPVFLNSDVKRAIVTISWICLATENIKVTTIISELLF